MRLLARHPHLDAATAAGSITISWAQEIAAWTGRIDHDELQTEADKILVDAADRRARTSTTSSSSPRPPTRPGAPRSPTRRTTRTAAGSATGPCTWTRRWTAPGRIRGDLTPECAAAVTAVLEALGKRRGPEDFRSAGQRYHDALQEGCELLIRAKMVPDRAGADTRVDVIIPLSDLLGMDGASVIEDTWLRARAGQHGYLAGKDAEAIACDALIVPVVTGSPDWAVISEMIALVTGAYAHAEPRRARGRGQDGPPNPPSPPSPPGPPGQPARPGPGPQPLDPEAWEALQHALARLAIRFVSGPGAIASALRRGLLGAPLNTRSVLLDVGYRDTIPDSIRRAVILRDKHCAWSGGCDRRPAVSDVHHINHKKDGGTTSVTDCALLCNYHHDICIHRLGWKFELLPDGSTRATSPDGKTILRSHPPPPPQPSG